jgi:hypothetical protein
MRLVSLTKSSQAAKKYTAVFSTDAGGTKTVHFGAAGYQDYTQHHDPERRKAYLARHRSKENWSVPDTAGSLSAHLLWGQSTSFRENLAAFRKKFNV